MNKRTEYHREYYWRNVEKRRKQRMASKTGMIHKRLKVKPSDVSKLMRLWV